MLIIYYRSICIHIHIRIRIYIHIRLIFIFTITSIISIILAIHSCTNGACD